MEEKYWKQFESSGRIEDYLSFVNSTGQERSAGDAASPAGVSAREGAASAGADERRQQCRII